MKKSKIAMILGLIIVLTCGLVLNGCISYRPVKADLESVAIEVYGYESGAAEIEVLQYLDEYVGQRSHSLSLSSKVAWQDGRGDYTVSWNFLGDDLGCVIRIRQGEQV